MGCVVGAAQYIYLSIVGGSSNGTCRWIVGPFSPTNRYHLTIHTHNIPPPPHPKKQKRQQQQSLATFLQQTIPSEKIIATVIGIFSAIIDNVPLVRPVF